jgi:hypothetical protein
MISKSEWKQDTRRDRRKAFRDDNFLVVWCWKDKLKEEVLKGLTKECGEVNK